jgi:hypothetical protein
MSGSQRSQQPDARSLRGNDKGGVCREVDSQHTPPSRVARDQAMVAKISLKVADGRMTLEVLSASGR